MKVKILMSYIVPDGWSEGMFLRWMNNWFTKEIFAAHQFLWDIEADDIIFGFDHYFLGKHIDDDDIILLSPEDQERVQHCFELCHVLPDGGDEE